MNQVIPFIFDECPVRTVVVEDSPWWVGKDVCQVLGYRNHIAAMDDHCKGARKLYPVIDSRGCEQKYRIISEGDVFRLIVNSHLPQADRFEKKFTEEILPRFNRNNSSTESRDNKDRHFEQGLNKLVPFAYGDSIVRTAVIDNEPWWVAIDVCQILELENITKALYGLDDDEKMTLTNSKGHSGQRGGPQSFNIVNESGLYSLIFRSRKPEAKSFKKWVTSEVLPQIRKTGAYAAVALDTQTLSKINDTLAAASKRIEFLESSEARLRERERLYRKAERLEALLAKKNTPLSDDEKAQIKLLRSTASATQIARLLNRSPSAVRRVLNGGAE